MKSLASSSYLTVAAGFLCLIFILGASATRGDEYFVSTSGSDVTGDGSASLPWATISKAVDAVGGTEENPARIRVAGGTYEETLSLKPYVEIYGGYDPSDWSRIPEDNATILNPPDSLAADTVIQAADHTILDELTIKGGATGIQCEGVSPQINGCRIEENTTFGIFVTGGAASPHILYNTITGNKEGIFLYHAGAPIITYNNIQANSGNAITIQKALPWIENNVLSDNSLSGLNISSVTSGTISSNKIYRNNKYGIFSFNSMLLFSNNCIGFNDSAGLYCNQNSHARILFNTLYQNQSGIVLRDSSPEITNNISCNNDYYGVYEVYKNSDPILRNNCLWGNASGNYKDEGTTSSWVTEDFVSLIDNDGAPIDGNFAKDPLLRDAAKRDFHLLPESPCIDTGYRIDDVSFDFEQEPRDIEGVDIGADEAGELFSFHFHTGDQDWQLVTIPTAFSPPASWSKNGTLMLRARDANTFGYWESPKGLIPVSKNTLYRARWKVSTDVVNQGVAPGLRLRLNEEDFQINYKEMVNSNLNGDASPTPGGIIYNTYCRVIQGSPQKQKSQGVLLCSFDMINLNPDDQEDGAIFLEEMILDWTDLEAIKDQFTLEKSFDFENDTDGWELRTVPGVFDPPEQANGLSHLGLRSVSTNTFGYWESPPQPVSAQKIYRVRFYISTDVGEPSKVPMLRIRVNALINQASHQVSVDSSGEGESSPVPNEWTPYDIYYRPQESAEAQGVYLAFDLINLNPDDQETGALFLERVEVHSMTFPLF